MKCLVCFTVLWLCPTSAGWAATIHVPDDQPTIQAGIDAAESGDDVFDGSFDRQINVIDIEAGGGGTPRVRVRSPGGYYRGVFWPISEAEFAKFGIDDWQ